MIFVTKVRASRLCDMQCTLDLSLKAIINKKVYQYA